MTYSSRHTDTQQPPQTGSPPHGADPARRRVAWPCASLRTYLFGIALAAAAPAALFTSYQLILAPSDAGSVHGVFAMLVVASVLLGAAAAWLLAGRIANSLRDLTVQGMGTGETFEVTEIRQLRDGLRLAQREREDEAAERARADKGELLSKLGHELRNPLNAIVVSVEVLHRASSDDAVASTARAVLARQTQKLVAMLDQWQRVDRKVGEVGPSLLDDRGDGVRPQ